MANHKPTLRKKLSAAQNGLCCYCEKIMVRYNFKATPSGGLPNDAETIEHLNRKAEGGKGGHDNVALACFECNTGRGAIDWLTYKSYRMGES